jgi:hypothetical protein
LASGTTLPPGLSLSSGGTISGTPTTAGTYVFKVSLSDGTLSATSGLLTLIVSAAPAGNSNLTVQQQAQALATQYGGKVVTLPSGSGLSGYAINFGGMVMNASLVSQYDASAGPYQHAAVPFIAAWQEAYGSVTSITTGYNGLSITWAFDPASGGNAWDLQGNVPWYLGTDSQGNQYYIQPNIDYAANPGNLPFTSSGGHLYTLRNGVWSDPTGPYDYGTDGFSGTGELKIPILNSLSLSSAAPGTDVTISGLNIYSGPNYYNIQFLNSSGNVVDLSSNWPYGTATGGSTGGGPATPGVPGGGGSLNSINVFVLSNPTNQVITKVPGSLTFTVPGLPAGNYTVRLSVVQTEKPPVTAYSNALPLTVTAGNGTYGLTPPSITMTNSENVNPITVNPFVYNTPVTTPPPIANGTPWPLKVGDTITFTIKNGQPNAGVYVLAPSVTVGWWGFSMTSIPGSIYDWGQIGTTDANGNFTYTTHPFPASANGNVSDIQISVGNNWPTREYYDLWLGIGVVTAGNPVTPPATTSTPPVATSTVTTPPASGSNTICSGLTDATTETAVSNFLTDSNDFIQGVQWTYAGNTSPQSSELFATTAAAQYLAQGLGGTVILAYPAYPDMGSAGRFTGSYTVPGLGTDEANAIQFSNGCVVNAGLVAEECVGGRASNALLQSEVQSMCNQFSAANGTVSSPLSGTANPSVPVGTTTPPPTVTTPVSTSNICTPAGTNANTSEILAALEQSLLSLKNLTGGADGTLTQSGVSDAANAVASIAQTVQLIAAGQ